LPLEARFTFFDQIHSTGMDIRQAPGAVAALSLGKDMTFRDFAQGRSMCVSMFDVSRLACTLLSRVACSGAFRMRGLAKGQRLQLLVSHFAFAASRVTRTAPGCIR
jgi:hypothetical protein